MFSMKEHRETNYFLHSGRKVPKNEPPSLKTMDFRVKNSIDLRVGNHNIHQKLRDIQRDF